MLQGCTADDDAECTRLTRASSNDNKFVYSAVGHDGCLEDLGSYSLQQLAVMALLYVFDDRSAEFVRSEPRLER
jgi:hypothetical protein